MNNVSLVNRKPTDDYMEIALRAQYPEMNTLDPSTGLPLGNYRNYSIFLDDSIYLGHAMIYRIDNIKHEAELGVSISNKPYWDKGIGTHIMNKLIQICVDNKFRRVYTKVVADNARALRHEQECGFIQYSTTIINNTSFILLEKYL